MNSASLLNYKVKGVHFHTSDIISITFSAWMPPLPYLDHKQQSNASTTSLKSFSDMATMSYRKDRPRGNSFHPYDTDTESVSLELEMTRESLDAAVDPKIRNILEQAVTQIWVTIQLYPNSYVMTRDDFSVFNYFQHHFTLEEIAVVHIL